MDTQLIVALISAGVAVAAAGFTVWGQSRTAHLAAGLEDLRLAEERSREAERTAARYLEPLTRAAYDLQSRLYNILEQKMLQAFFDEGGDRERSYVVDNTSYVVAQYFGWTEIVRQAIQYVDLARDERTLQLTLLQDQVNSLFQTDDFVRPMRIFAGEQRAIGERLILEGTRGLECMGYSAFLDYITKGGDPLIEALRSDARGLSANLQRARPRLVAIQHALIDLLAFLDPNFVRSPKEKRSKVSAKEPGAGGGRSSAIPIS